MGVWDRWLGRGSGDTPAPSDPIEQALSEFANAAETAPWDQPLDAIPGASVALLAAPAIQIRALEFTIAAMHATLERRATLQSPMAHHNVLRRLRELAGELLRRPLPYQESHLCSLLELSHMRSEIWFPGRAIVIATKKWLGDRRPPADLATALAALRDFLNENMSNAEQRKLRDRLDEMLREPSEKEAPFERVDAWTSTFLEALDAAPPRSHTTGHFSELMRDVDLFVGVASVGNDPNWVDSGHRGGLPHVYWESFAFGELGETAKTRREALARIVGKLKIADRCELEERFLVVRGDLHTYRIHLGSANIQRASDNQYLCIVLDRSTRGAGKVMLPFEGDSTLSLILSKAFLLAEDRKIKDPTILSQLRR